MDITRISGDSTKEMVFHISRREFSGELYKAYMTPAILEETMAWPLPQI